MNPAVVSAVVLGLGVLAGSVRLLWPRPAATRVGPWRTALLLIGPAAAALLLYRAMFPPDTRATPAALVVVTARATDAQLARIEPQARVVALPEAPASAAFERVADLATAAMVASRSQRPDAQSPGGAPGTPWPYLLGCLVELGATWGSSGRASDERSGAHFRNLHRRQA